jgi:exopolyphosphatase/pppGpp-phosphohydrolase
VRYWDSLVRAHIVGDLRKTLKEGRKRKFRPGITPTEDTIRSSVSSLANQFPEGLTHSHAVTSLALMLFDDLADLHRMDTHERFLLECAGYLHDIGWKFGQKGHARHSAEMIISDENLLLDIIDRGIIALVCRAHRGKVHPESNGMFSLLSSQERNSVMMLASLLRIADGLDYSHNGAIGSVHCTMYADEVLLEISAIRGVSAEIKRAQQKGDLFTRVFKRKLVIQ